MVCMCTSKDGVIWFVVGLFMTSLIWWLHVWRDMSPSSSEGLKLDNCPSSRGLYACFHMTVNSIPMSLLIFFVISIATGLVVNFNKTRIFPRGQRFRPRLYREAIKIIKNPNGSNMKRGIQPPGIWKPVIHDDHRPENDGKYTNPS